MAKRFVVAVILAIGASSAANAQIAVILGSGPAGGGPTATSTPYVNASSDVKAVAVTEIVTLNLNPLNAGLVQLLADGLESPAPIGSLSSPLALGPGAALFAGSPPPGALGNLGLGTASPGGGGGGGGSGGGGISSGSPLLGVGVKVPENGNPGEVSFTATDPAGNVLGGGWVTYPEGGWWVIGISDGTSVSSTSTTSNRPLASGSGPTPGPSPGSTADTPEPGTLVLACVGLIAITSRRRRLSGSIPWTLSRPA